MEKDSSQIADLLQFYIESGVTVAVGQTPTDYYTYNPPTAAPLPAVRKSVPYSVKEPPLPFNSSQTLSQGGLMPRIGLKGLEKEFPSIFEAVQNCQTLSQLRDTLSHFEGCALKATATNMVFSDGNPEAKIMVIGEAPGADEDKQGLPFVGLSGRLLDRMLATIGLSRQENIYVTNIIPWRPPGNRQPTTQEIALCQPFIERHIELINPKILILVGGISAKTILNSTEGIMKLRGQWHTFQTARLSNPIATLPTFHPAFLLRSPGQKAQVWQDLLLIKKKIEEIKEN